MTPPITVIPSDGLDIGVDVMHTHPGFILAGRGQLQPGFLVDVTELGLHGSIGEAGEFVKGRMSSLVLVQFEMAILAGKS